MLDDAGYTMGPTAYASTRSRGKPLEFRFYSRTSDQNSIDIVPYVKGWMQQIGIKLDAQTLNSNKLGNVILAGDYDLFEWGWYPNPDPNSILNIFTCAQRPPDANTYRNSDSYYCNPDYDKLYKQQALGDDSSERIDIVHQMQAILYRDQPYLVLWNGASLEAYSPDWTGFRPATRSQRGRARHVRPAVVHQHPARERDVGGWRRLIGRHPGRRLDRHPRGGGRHHRGFADDPQAPRGGRGRGLTGLDERNERG